MSERTVKWFCGKIAEESRFHGITNTFFWRASNPKFRDMMATREKKNNSSTLFFKNCWRTETSQKHTYTVSNRGWGRGLRIHPLTDSFVVALQWWFKAITFHQHPLQFNLKCLLRMKISPSVVKSRPLHHWSISLCPGKPHWLGCVLWSCFRIIVVQ